MVRPSQRRKAQQEARFSNDSYSRDEKIHGESKCKLFQIRVKPIHFGLTILICVGLLYNERSKNCIATDMERFLRLGDTDTSTTDKGCTSLQKRLIQKQLPTAQSIMDKTRCPDSSAWLTQYLQVQQDKDAPSTDPFVFLNFGCNKGYDSIFIAEQVSRNSDVFNKQKWNDALGSMGGPGVCGQGMSSNKAAQATLLESNKNNNLPNNRNRPVQVHCIEAMPVTAQKLKAAADQTTAAAHGLHVYNYAMSGTPGKTPILFPNPQTKAGQEDFGIQHCQTDPALKPQCVKVPTRTIDEFVQEHVTTSTSTTTHTSRIPFLSIDVEGFDYTLMKAATETLARTNYLEFEYHDRGDWKQQKLEDATRWLKDEYGFVCYWSGRNKLWRLTDSCWMEYMEIHMWSNVACVQPMFAPTLAHQMNTVFENTLVQG